MNDDTYELTTVVSSNVVGRFFSIGFVLGVASATPIASAFTLFVLWALQ